MTAIATLCAVNQSSEYKDEHYVVIAVMYLSVFQVVLLWQSEHNISLVFVLF